MNKETNKVDQCSGGQLNHYFIKQHFPVKPVQLFFPLEVLPAVLISAKNLRLLSFKEAMDFTKQPICFGLEMQLTYMMANRHQVIAIATKQ